MAKDVLDFAILDEAVLAADRGIPIVALAQTWADKCIGPLVEYAYLQQPHHLPALKASSTLNALADAMSNDRHNRSTSLQPLGLEFSRLPPDRGSLVNDAAWTAFVKRLHKGAETAGFDKLVGAGFAGAFMELVENVFLHSRRPRSGVVGYRCGSLEFEFVVADSGDGVLRSLRRSSEHSALSDSGTALKMALQGHSRLGKGHGNGFRPLFATLASLHGEVRCRSGNYALEMAGQGVSVNKADIRQRAIYQGLLVSILCRVRAPRRR